MLGQADKAAAERLTVIIVTYNSCAVVGDAIASIPAGVPVIVVDNASRDGTVDLIRGEFPAVTVIANPRNVGFGPANNIALAKVASEFALLMNPDARFNDQRALDGLLSAADRYPEAAILGPEIAMENGELQGGLPAPLAHRRQMNKQHANYMEDVVGDVCAYSLSGALMLLRMSAFRDQTHFFDPNIFMYFEDDDLCMSAKQRGYASIYVPGVQVLHMVGKSSPPTLEIEALKTRHKTFAQLYVMGKYGRKRDARNKALRILIKNGLLAAWLMVAFQRGASYLCAGRALAAANFLMADW